MKVSPKMKPFTWGIAIGAVAMLIALPSGFGWYTPGGAEKLAKLRADSALVSVLAPVCAEKFAAQADAAKKKVELSKAAQWDRRKLFNPTWITLPGEGYPDTGLADKCIELVLKQKGV